MRLRIWRQNLAFYGSIVFVTMVHCIERARDLIIASRDYDEGLRRIGQHYKSGRRDNIPAGHLERFDALTSGFDDYDCGHGEVFEVWVGKESPDDPSKNARDISPALIELS